MLLLLLLVALVLLLVLLAGRPPCNAMVSTNRVVAVCALMLGSSLMVHGPAFTRFNVARVS